MACLNHFWGYKSFRSKKGINNKLVKNDKCPVLIKKKMGNKIRRNKKIFIQKIFQEKYSLSQKSEFPKDNHLCQN